MIRAASHRHTTKGVSDRREDKEDNSNEGWNPGGVLPMATVAVATAAAAAAGWGRAVREGKRKGGGGGGFI